MSVTLNGTSGLVFSDGTIQGTAGAMAFRNRIINGAFEIWQRGTARTLLGSGTPYLADRWNGCQGFQNGAHQRVAMSSAPADLSSQYAMRVSSSTTAEAAGGTRIDCSQKIESINCYDLAGKSITVSFWMRASAATFTSVTNTTESNFGAWTARVQYNTSTTDSGVSTDTGNGSTTVTAVTGTNAAIGGTNLLIANGSLPTTWTKYTFTSTVPANTKNLTLRFASTSLGNTASADTVWYEVAEVQLERGSAATDFERRPIVTELAMCQRYYNQAKTGAYPGAFAFISMTTNSTIGSLSFPVTMRSTPTVAISWLGVANNMGNVSSAVAVTAVPAQVWWTKDGILGVQANSPFIAGIGYGFDYTASAEL